MEVDLPRYQKPNPYNYTKVELAKKERDLKAIIRDYPSIPPLWCEWLYDVVEHMPKEEQERIINSGELENKGKFAKPLGGVFNSVEVFNEDFTPYEAEALLQ